jgi:hypothetical protein
MKLITENGMVTFVMRTGKDKVRSKMSIAEAYRIMKSGKKVVETDTEVNVDDKYFFPIELEKKSRKKKDDEVSENE